MVCGEQIGHDSRDIQSIWYQRHLITLLRKMYLKNPQLSAT